MGKNIVVNVSNDPLNRSVCEYGIYLAKNLNLDITFLYVVKTMLLSPNYLGLATGALVVTPEDSALIEDMKPSKEQIDEGNEILKKAKNLAKEHGVTAYSDLRSGDLIETLIDYCGAHTIVVGTQDQNEEIKNNIVALTRECKSPLFFINKEFSPINSALVAFDGGESSIKTLNYLKSNPIFGKKLDLVVANVEKDEKKSKQILDQAKEILGDQKVEFINLSGNTSEELIKYRRANNLDIYIMGSFSKGIFATLFFGSTSQDIVEQALVPIFIAG